MPARVSLSEQTHWDAKLTDRALPISLYLTHRPAFFDRERGYVWPWVDPNAMPRLGALPARARHDAGTPFVQP